MKNKVQILGVIFFVGLLIFIYRYWFLSTEIIGGDWPYYSAQLLKSFSFPPLSWAFWRGNGLGDIDVSYALHIYEHATILFTTLFNIPWAIVSKLCWFGFFLLFSFISVFYLYKVIFPGSSIWQKLLAIFIYSTNTYILLVVSGGQMGYALGYAIAPIVLAFFIQGFATEDKKYMIRSSVRTSLSLGFLFLLDIRIAYLVLLLAGAYYLIIFLFLQRKNVLHGLLQICTPLLGAVLLNLSWIIPIVLFKQNPVSEVASGYDSITSLKFFSFADFSHALSLLHPNWPENIFGKIYFLQPEFLVLPILAFCSLFFVKLAQSKKDMDQETEGYFVIFFMLIGLIGIFLAKGVQDPFGYLYQLFFQHIPGFVMFRDATKFYTYIALSYCVLIPFTIQKISQLVSRSKQEVKVLNVFILGCIFFIGFWLVLIRYAVFGQLSGTFQHHVIPQEYIDAAKFIDQQPDFFRTMWVPKQSRFSDSSTMHPLVEAEAYFNSTSSAEVISKLQEASTQKKLQNISVKYIIVPYDSLGEIFLKDRKYDAKEYAFDVHALQQIPWIHQEKKFNKIAVFVVSKYNDHFSLEKPGKVTYIAKNTTEYTVDIQTQMANSVIFSENYNPSWVGVVNGNIIHSSKTSQGLMRFIIPQKGNYHIQILFNQQQYYSVGFIISGIVFILFVGILIMIK